jgi:hypothetical protein
MKTYPGICVALALLAAADFSIASVIVREGMPTNPEMAREALRTKLNTEMRRQGATDPATVGCRTLFGGYEFSDIADQYPLENCQVDAVRIWQEIQRADKEAARDEQRQREMEAATRILEEAKRKLAQEQRIIAIREGKVQAADLQELLAATRAEDGFHLGASPMLKPDQRRYSTMGVIEQFRGQDILILRASQGFVAEIHARVYGAPFPARHLAVVVTPKLRAVVEQRAAIGRGITVTGLYIRNLDLRAENGSTKKIPVLQATEVGWWD